MRGYYYSAAGNTFLVVDSRNEKLSDEIKKLLVIKYVREMDGAIFVEDGFMDYFNRDGNRAEFCGNGARTYVAFVCTSEKKDSIEFDTFSGHLRGFVDSTFNVEMPKILYRGEKTSNGISGELLNVGVPHFVTESETENVNWKPFIGVRHELDANVNIFQEIEPGLLRVRTFERGVERETGACGSGSTATAWCYREKNGKVQDKIRIKTNGGMLVLTFEGEDIFLGGGVERCSEELELLL